MSIDPFAMAEFKDSVRGLEARLEPRGHTATPSEVLAHELEVAFAQLQVAEEELAVSDEQSQANRIELEQRWLHSWDLFDGAPGAYITTSTSGKITSANQAAVKLLDCDHQRLIGRSLPMLVTAEDRPELNAAIHGLDPGGATVTAQFSVNVADRVVPMSAAIAMGVHTAGHVELRCLLKTDAHAVTTASLHNLAVFTDDLSARTKTMDLSETLSWVSRRCVELLGADGCGFMLVGADGSLGVGASSDQTAEFLERFEVQHQEGPCFESYRDGNINVVDDLTALAGKWPRFVELGLAAGFRSVLAVPLKGERTFGAANIFSRTPSFFHDAPVSMMTALVSVTSFVVAQERSLSESKEVSAQLQSALDSRVLIEQAKGAVMSRYGVDAQRAFEMLRRYSRNNNRPLRAVCDDVVDSANDATELIEEL